MNIDFQAQRVKMVDGQLRTTDVTGHALLQAYLDVPREMFVPQAKRALAYLDADIEIAPGRFLGEASPVAKLIALAGQAQDNLRACGAGNVSVEVGDMASGCAKRGPYDVIVFSGSIADVPPALFDQLKSGGRLAAVVGSEKLGAARLFVKTSGDVSSRFGFNAALKPLPGFNHAPVFAL